MTTRRRPEPPARTAADDQAMRDRGFAPFIRAEHVTDGEWLKLTGFNHAGLNQNNATQIKLEVENEHGENFTIGVLEGSPDHRTMFREFGADWRTWVGGIQVTVAAGRQRGSFFVNIKSADKQGPVWDGPASDDPGPGDQDR